jgi:methionyl-tRNA synthetase
MSQQVWFITTPIYYPSDRLHIGHAYTTVAADALARYHRLRGEAVWFSTGTDEHGQKIARAAQTHGMAPEAFVDGIVASIRQLWDTLQISYDDFVRTTEPRHEAVVQAIFQKLLAQGDIYKGQYEGWYCEPDEAFWLESRLENGKCPDCGRPVKRVAEESYFFRLSRYQDRLLKHFQAHPEFVEPESRLHEMVNFVQQGLEDLSVSRKGLAWGIPVPGDPDHTIYVWFDALINYVTSAGYLTDPARFARTWPANLHLVGKEIVRFHSVIWPIMLMALDLPLPDRVFGHGWLLLGDAKISKSRGNIIEPGELVRRYGVDAVRYYLLREVPFGADGTYTEEALVQRINVDLANDLGNLLHRTVAMVTRFNAGTVPPYRLGVEPHSLRRAAEAAAVEVEEAMERLELHRAVLAVQGLVREANRYIEERQPWALHRDPAARELLDDVLYNLAEVLRVISVLLTPFLVEAPRRIRHALGLGDEPVVWADVAWGGLAAGSVVQAGEPLFRRIEETEQGGEPPAEERAEPEPELLSIDDFRRWDLRVARVQACTRVENADRLLRLTLQLGGESRTVVSGIAQHYAPADLVGKSVVVVTNLKPATIRGIRSEGMILAASDASGRLAIVGPWSDVQSGSRVT